MGIGPALVLLVLIWSLFLIGLVALGVVGVKTFRRRRDRHLDQPSA